MDFGPTVDVVDNEIQSKGIFSFFSVTISLSVILGLLGFMFCALLAFIIRRYRRFRYGIRRKFKSSDEDLVEQNVNYDSDSEQENEIFSIRLHTLQNNLQDGSSILSPIPSEDILIQDSTVSSTTSDRRFSLCCFFRKFLK